MFTTAGSFTLTVAVMLVVTSAVPVVIHSARTCCFGSQAACTMNLHARLSPGCAAVTFIFICSAPTAAAVSSACYAPNNVTDSTHKKIPPIKILRCFSFHLTTLYVGRCRIVRKQEDYCKKKLHFCHSCDKMGKIIFFWWCMV